MNKRKTKKAEEWRPVVGYEGVYSVSNQGRVVRVKSSSGTQAGRILKDSLNVYGYPTVNLSKGSKTHLYRTHRLAAAAFIGPCPDDEGVNHIDGNKRNNCVENLEYVTQAENSRHASRLGLLVRGERVHCSKLTEDDVFSIRGLLGEHKQKDIGRMFGVGQVCVHNIAAGKTWGWLKEEASCV